MKNIVIGIVKSTNSIKLKKVLVEKLYLNGTFFQTVNFSELVYDLEEIWFINESLVLMSDSCVNSATDQLKLTYEKLKEQGEVLEFLFDLYASNAIDKLPSNNVTNNDVELNMIKYQHHLLELVSNTFLPEINVPNNSVLVKNKLLILIEWCRLLVESFYAKVLLIVNPSSHELVLSLLHILSRINLNLSVVESDRINFLYFLQNDTKFCLVYLNLIKSLFALLENYNDALIKTSELQVGSFNGDEYDKFNHFRDSVLFETICLLTKSVSLKQPLSREQKARVEQQLKPHENVNFLKELFFNLTLIVEFLKAHVTKSNKMFELCLKYLIDLLCTHPSAQLNPTVAPIFNCFDLNISNAFIKNFFYESEVRNVPVDENVIKSLLSNFVCLLSWPFENNIHLWIRLFMTLLAVQAKKLKLLIQVCEENCDYILDLVSAKTTSNSALYVLSFFLINYQHSPKLFHKSCPKIKVILEDLKCKFNAENVNAEEKDFLLKVFQKLGLLSFICITNFGGYPQLYKPILEIIQTDIDLSNFETYKNEFLINNSNLRKEEMKNQTIEIGDDDEFTICPKVRANFTGLVNLGNTCYLNSIVQSLFACRNFLKSILEIDTNELPVDRYVFLNQLQVLFSIMYLTNRPSVKPTNFVKFCTPEWFRFGQQQDSSEFLIYFLDNLNEQLKNLKNIEQLSSFAPLVDNSFGIQLKTEVECQNCKTRTYRTDVSFYLPLSFNCEKQNKQRTLSAESSNEPPTSSVANAPRESLQTLLNNYFDVEMLSGENNNSYSCSRCESLQNAAKRIILVQEESRPAPAYLVLTLNRFIYTMNSDQVQNKKILDQLEYPEQIYLRTLLNDTVVVEKYTCIAIVVHSGSSIHHGHYYSYIRNTINLTEDSKSLNEPNNSDWFLANDSQMSQTSFKSLISNLDLFKNDTPYVLFYTRCSNMSERDQIQVKNTRLIDVVDQDNRVYDVEEKTRLLKRKKNEKTAENDYNYVM